MFDLKPYRSILCFTVPTLAAIFASVLIQGCGGAAAGSPAQNVSTIHVGQAAISFVGPQPRALASATGVVSIVGEAGTSLTNVTVEPNPTLANTSILYYYAGPAGYVNALWIQTGGVVQEVIDSAETFLDATFSPNGKIIFSRMDPVTNLYQLYSCNYDGSALTQLSKSLRLHEDPACAPNGAEVAFDDGDNVWIENLATLAETKLSAPSAIEPAWSPDGTKIAYVIPANSDSVAYMPVAGGTAVVISGTNTECLTPAWSPTLTGFPKIAYSSAAKTPYTTYIVDPSAPTYSETYPINGSSPSFSPDGKYLSLSSGGGGSPRTLVAATVDGQQETTLATAPAGFTWVGNCGWSPFLGNQQFVGSSPTLLPSAAGFIWSQVSDSFAAFVAFQATTPTKATITLVSAPPGGAIICDLHADSITSLKYSNGYYVLPTSLTLNTADTLISFSGSTGQVTTVAPFIARPAEGVVSSRGSGVGVQRQFTGVFDSTGRNLAPNGASAISLDPKTGKPTVLR